MNNVYFCNKVTYIHLWIKIIKNIQSEGASSSIMSGNLTAWVSPPYNFFCFCFYMTRPGMLPSHWSVLLRAVLWLAGRVSPRHDHTRPHSSGVRQHDGSHRPCYHLRMSSFDLICYDFLFGFDISVAFVFDFEKLCTIVNFIFCKVTASMWVNFKCHPSTYPPSVRHTQTHWECQNDDKMEAFWSIKELLAS